jgi:hypothetical protein
MTFKMQVLLVTGTKFKPRGGFRGGVRDVRPLKFAKHMLYNVN